MYQMIHQHKNQLTLLAGFFLFFGFITKFFRFAGGSEILLILATLVAMVPIVLKAWQALRRKVFSIELLVTVAVLGALFIHEYTESSVVTFLFLFGDYLEARTLEKTRSSLKALTEMAPQEAHLLLEDGSRKAVSIAEVKPADLLAVLPGGKIPVDGSIIKGQAVINEAAVTGESVPVNKASGDKVYTGTILESGYVEIVAEKVGDDTAFAKIIELVEEAQDAKSKTERFLDRFANLYTPVVTGLALAVYFLSRDLHLAITFLVIACPGALVIGAPVSTVAGIGNGAKNGVLIKGGEIMEKLSRVDTFVFDKTGTLTKGKPEVTDIRLFDGMEKDMLLALVGKAETISEHHLGQTLVKAARDRRLDLSSYELRESETRKGRGIAAMVNRHRLIVGNRKLMQEEGITVTPEAALYAQEREKGGNTAILAAVDGKLTAIISIADRLREDARVALDDMRKKGAKRFVMLTGDNRHTARAVAEELGIDEVHAELLPEEKVAYVKALKDQGAVVAMAGDGINDAPAIAAADIGLAMGASGTDVAMETADVVLMADKLGQYAHAYALAKATMRNMRQNIFIALGVVVFLLAGVLLGQIHLASGMLVHEGSVLVVILNAIRLTGFKRKVSPVVREKAGRVKEAVF